MVFNVDDYTDNIEYCKYVFDKNLEYNLGLDNPVDIQVVANIYIDELLELNDGITDENVAKNDLLLFEVVNEFLRKIKNKQLSPEDIHYIPKTDKDLKDLSQHERIKSSRGGYSFNESYDDFGLDELEPEDSIKL